MEECERQGKAKTLGDGLSPALCHILLAVVLEGYVAATSATITATPADSAVAVAVVASVYCPLRAGTVLVVVSTALWVSAFVVALWSK